MPLLRRLAAVLSSALLLQLMLLASGVLCTMRGAAMAEMTGAMNRPGQHTTIEAQVHGGAPTVTVADNQQRPDDCHQPWVPGTCVTMTSCLVVISAIPAGASQAVEVPASVAQIREPAAARAGPSFAPELPPPRG